MTIHLRNEVDKLKRKILALGAHVEESVQASIRALVQRDVKLAQRVIDGDSTIDQVEVDIEEDCLKVLALHQPVAIDLRFLVAVLKINNDLERIGDLAVNIAERAAFLANRDPMPIPDAIPEMAERAQLMLKNSLDALVNMNPAMAQEVCVADDEVDALNRSVYERVQNDIRNDPEKIERYITVLSVARQLERLADHATNIAEDVVYMVRGEIIRHKARQLQL